ncbi:MAG TPA: (2Fe-2S)-binding protein [Lamprocystis sp. (in: g-proteobacteria)]|nr:(2Fe-2S)-binding protein [Lamprocystis sp. (in: g-proteobacteria)]
MLTLRINGTDHQLELDPAMPLQWAIREHVGLTGTKYGCGIGQCGVCTVFLNGAPVRSCSTPASLAVGGEVLTIEGLTAGLGTAALGAAGRAVRAAWLELDVVQCGFCQSGQILAATALLAENIDPTEAEIDAAMSGILCRCATYSRIRAAIRRAVQILADEETPR